MQIEQEINDQLYQYQPLEAISLEKEIYENDRQVIFENLENENDQSAAEKSWITSSETLFENSEPENYHEEPPME